MENSIESFKNDNLMKSFYKYVNDHHLRREAFKLVHKRMGTKPKMAAVKPEDEASYDEVVE